VEHWYVYYVVPEAERDTVLPIVRRLQESLDAAGVRARLEERVDPDRSPTWMEVYEGVKNPDAFRQAMATALAASGLSDELRNARHVERFKVL
jgi:Domain of unknown function (DUF4936)